MTPEAAKRGHTLVQAIERLYATKKALQEDYEWASGYKLCHTLSELALTCNAFEELTGEFAHSLIEDLITHVEQAIEAGEEELEAI